MYDFDGDVSTFYTGEKNLALSGLLATYNRAPKLPQWDLPCGVVKDSSDGTKFQSLIKENDTLLFFRKSLCRAMPLVSLTNPGYVTCDIVIARHVEAGNFFSHCVV